MTTGDANEMQHVLDDVDDVQLLNDGNRQEPEEPLHIHVRDQPINNLNVPEASCFVASPLTPASPSPEYGQGMDDTPVPVLELVKEAFMRFLFLRKWLQGYNLSKLRSDAMAGLTVGIMAIPQRYVILSSRPTSWSLAIESSNCSFQRLCTPSQNVLCTARASLAQPQPCTSLGSYRQVNQAVLTDSA